MLLECIRTELLLPQTRRLGDRFSAGQEFPVRIGERYVAFGLRLWGCGLWVDIEGPSGYLITVPLPLFTIIDGSVPNVWEARVDDDGDLAMLPTVFHDPYFIDDLSEGQMHAIRAFKAVKEMLAGSTKSQEKHRD